MTHEGCHDNSSTNKLNRDLQSHKWGRSAILLFCFQSWCSTLLVCFSLTPLQRRRLEGCLCRVPIHFYVQVWDVMSRTPQGITVQGNHLPQNPTLSNMTQSELNFALLIEEMLNHIQKPEYRQTVVEVSTLCVFVLYVHLSLLMNSMIIFLSAAFLQYILQPIAHLHCLHFSSFEWKCIPGVSFLL